MCLMNSYWNICKFIFKNFLVTANLFGNISQNPVRCDSWYVPRGKKKPGRGLTLKSIEGLCKLLIAYIHFGRFISYNIVHLLIKDYTFWIEEINQSLVSVYY